MRKLTLLLAFSLSTVLAGSPKLAVVAQHVAGGQLVVEVRNDSEVPATAILVGSSAANSGSVDFLLGAREGRSLKPGEIAEVKASSPGAGEVRVLGAIFEDGSLEGDTRPLVAAREEVHSQLPMALSMLRNDNVQTDSAATVANWFHQWQVRWLAADPTRSMAVARTAEAYMVRSGDAQAAAPARDLIKAFEELSAKLAASKPVL